MHTAVCSLAVRIALIDRHTAQISSREHDIDVFNIAFATYDDLFTEGVSIYRPSLA